MSKMKPIEIFLPSLSSKYLNHRFNFEDELSKNQNIEISSIFHKTNLAERLCQSIGYDQVDLPWNQLRAIQFNLSDEFQNLNKRHTLACCDPVMMQVTHRGAYLWGQDSINFSTEDTIAIIAQVNDKLMDDGESFYLLNNKQWLYVNEKYIELKQASFENEIGRDQFGFSYSGKDGVFWDRLSTEIQMLIKQMIDYNGLSGVPNESLVNVHFWGDSANQLNSIININNKAFRIYTEDQLLNCFFEKQNVVCENLVSLECLFTNKYEQPITIEYAVESDWLSNLLTDLNVLVYSKENRKKQINLVLQDKIITIKPKLTFFQKVFSS